MLTQISITESYLYSVFKLDNQSKKQTINTVKQLAENSRSTSLQIHSIDRIRCDKSFRSARVNLDIRIILAMRGNEYILLYVDRHDDAYDWCEGKFLKKTNFGAEYIYDEKVMLEAKVSPELENPFYDLKKEFSLLKMHSVKDKHLKKLGIPEVHSENLLNIYDEDIFIDYIAIFPSELQEALLDLATGAKSFEDVINNLTDTSINNGNDNRPQKDTKRRFYTPQSMEELEILMENDDFEKWTIFLHPSQESIVKKNFLGPALIEGGPGTGKTIVGIHRAVYLAENIYKFEDDKKILLCTFSKKLAKFISNKIDFLMKQHGVKNNVHVMSVDSFIYNSLKSVNPYVPNVSPYGFSNLLNKLYSKYQPKGTKNFYEFEYYEVIEKYNIKTLDEYLAANRKGTGLPLDKKSRIATWKFIEILLKEKNKMELTTYVDRAWKFHEAIDNGNYMPEYDSIIIDEAQDLEPIKLKVLCRCIKSDTNNVMILSDMNQRIFKLGTWKNDGGINVVGRTHHLSVNYRTTKQINDYAKYQFVNSEIIMNHIKEYKSIVNGSEPTVAGFMNEKEQFKYILDKVKELLSYGLKDYQICIICPTKNECFQIESLFTFSDIKSTLLLDDIYPNSDCGVCICPIHGVKGLEFEAVIIYNYNNIGNNRLKDIESPEVKINYYKLVECEKYVASTRARNELIITYLESSE